ncbi:unnamed protein product, partial [Candidula unifasciata]
KKWVAVLSREHPTLAFRASITNCFGKGDLISLLRQFGKLHKDKKQISIGLIGYPNVGKSSIINALKSKKVCNVAPIPGETKVWQYVTLMSNIFLIDCPGIVYPVGATPVDMVLKGVVRVEKVNQPEDYVQAVLDRVKKEYVHKTYGVENWESPEDFLEQVARKCGRLLRGGEADISTVAKNVLNDYQRGKIPYFVRPPESEKLGYLGKKIAQVKQNLKDINAQRIERQLKKKSVEDGESGTVDKATTVKKETQPNFIELASDDVKSSESKNVKDKKKPTVAKTQNKTVNVSNSPTTPATGSPALSRKRKLMPADTENSPSQTSKQEKRSAGSIVATASGAMIVSDLETTPTVTSCFKKSEGNVHHHTLLNHDLVCVQASHLTPPFGNISLNICLPFIYNLGAFVANQKGAASGSSAKRRQKTREQDAEIDGESPRLTGLAKRRVQRREIMGMNKKNDFYKEKDIKNRRKHR